MVVPRKEDSLLDEGDSGGAGNGGSGRQSLLPTSVPQSGVGGSVELPLIWLPFLWEVGKTEKKRGKIPSLALDNPPYAYLVLYLPTAPSS